MAKSKITRFLKNPYRVFNIPANRGWLNWLSDRVYLKLLFRANIGRKLRLDAPKGFNEKLQWLKLYDRKPEYTAMVDKYEVKKYVAELIGEEYIIPTLGVWDKVEDIDFDSLPDRFVLKCTHDSGGLVICRDKAKLDIFAAKAKLEKSLRRNFYLYGREWPYKDVKPRIIAEQYLEDAESAELSDYKFYCFNGEPKVTLVCSGRFSNTGLHITFFDNEWNVMPFERTHPSVKGGLPKPQNYDEMIRIAKILSKDMPFIRVDFYEANGQIYFGELTFFPGCGLEAFRPEEWDYRLGDWLVLPEGK